MTTRYDGLDLMRVSGAALVVAHHYPSIAFGLAPKSAYLCVDMFFMLSGFVVAMNYSRSLHTTNDATKFMRDRLTRFWPLHMAALLAGTVLAITAIVAGREYMSISSPVTALAAGALFLPSGTGFAFALNPPAWSLAYEVAANAVYAYTARFLTRATLIAATVVTGAAFTCVIIRTGHADVGSDATTCALGAPRVAYDFAAGVLLARIPAKRFKVLPVVALAAAVGLPIFAIGDQAIYDLAYLSVIAPLAIWSRPRIPTWFRPIVRYTFPAYILHYPVLFASERALKVAGVHNPLVLAICLALALGVTCWAGELFAQAVRRKLGNHSVGADLPAPSFRSAKSATLPATGLTAVNVRTQPVTSPGRGNGIVSGA